MRKSFGSNLVLDGINFKIDKGESVVIMGGSGSGKSVLLKILIGLMPPDSGHVLIDREDIVHMDERELLRVRHKCGMVFQGSALFDSMTVGENVGFALRRDRSHPPEEIEKKVTEMLELVDLKGIEQKKPSELSGGMRKRVGLARAVIYQPQILLYDEPTTGLDPVISDSIDNLIQRVNDQLHVTSVVVTHDMRSARRLGKKTMFLHEHKVYAMGTAEEIFESKDPVIRKFVDGVSDDKKVELEKAKS